ncbi:MAG: glycosyltransferase family 4 protein, partial [Candidatus Omnitrophica bacterium]|nr:glycosyltransferase family 4 protein [Candidatus Omnitrophota bacterium]
SFGSKDEKIKEELGINNGELIIGTISCFKPQKAVGDFIRTAALLARSTTAIRFVIVGDGMLRPEIEKLIKKLELKDKVILAGWRGDIERILSALDIFVLTSLWEGLPVSVLEAIASGCPVVATDTGGIREVIKEGETGYLAPVRDIQKIAAKSLCLLKNKDLSKDISNAAKEHLGQDYTTMNMRAKTQDVYEELIKIRLSGDAN